MTSQPRPAPSPQRTAVADDASDALQRRMADLQARSEELRAGLAVECRVGWQRVSDPIDRVAKLKARAQALIVAAGAGLVRRPWLMLVPLAWRILRGRRRATRERQVLRAQVGLADERAALASREGAGGLVWAGRLATAWRIWKMARPFVNAWLDASRAGAPDAGRRRRH